MPLCVLGGGMFLFVHFAVKCTRETLFLTPILAQ